MNIEAIKAAVDAGQTVHWANTGYIVHKDALGQYLITYRHGGRHHWSDGPVGNPFERG